MSANVLVEKAMKTFNELTVESQNRVRIMLRCKSTDCLGCVRTKMSEMNDWELVHDVMEDMETLEKKSDILETELSDG